MNATAMWRKGLSVARQFLRGVGVSVLAMEAAEMGPELVVGEEFAGHRIERILGRGGMGVVYLAEHVRLGRMAAIKLLSPELATDPVFRRRFLLESQAAAALDHPNILPVYDAGESEGWAFIAMRYVDGADLSALLKNKGRLSPEASVRIVAQIASALDTAHGRGLIHRDVKPANILLERRSSQGPDPRAFLCDFGITQRLDGEHSTETEQFLGTIDYTAPEQIIASRVEPATDQYSLACVLYQCLTGSVPFPRDHDMAVISAHLQESPPIASESTDLAPRIDAVIQRGMAKAPARRFPSCSELVESAAEALGIPGSGAAQGHGPAAHQAVQAPRAGGLDGGVVDLSEVRLRRFLGVPVLRPARLRVDHRFPAGRGTEEGHRPVHRRDRVNGPRRATRPGGVSRGHGPQR